MENFLPQAYYGHVLLISRMDDPGVERYDLKLIPVTDMTEEDGAMLLLRRSGLIKSKTLITEAAEDDRQQAKEFSNTLVGLPLALDQAGAYIRANHKTIRDYARLYETRRAELLHLRGEYGFGHPDSVVTTWSLNFEKVGREAQELLRFFAFLWPDAIPEELIIAGRGVLGPILEPVASDELRLDSAAKNYSNTH